MINIAQVHSPHQVTQYCFVRPATPIRRKVDWRSTSGGKPSWIDSPQALLGRPKPLDATALGRRRCWSFQSIAERSVGVPAMG